MFKPVNDSVNCLLVYPPSERVIYFVLKRAIFALQMRENQTAHRVSRCKAV